MLSTLSGDKSAWPVYMSIGNLAKEKRRAVKSNGLILLGLLPKIPKNPARETTRKTFHEAIHHMLRPFEDAGRGGVDVVCADGYTRMVFPRIAIWIADYPEMITLTLVKSMWCPQCECPPDNLSSLTGTPFTPRIPAHYVLMSTAELESVGQWRFDFDNFATHHTHCNIYQAINPDRLHQLLKGVLKDHTWKWVCTYLTQEHGPHVMEEIDKRFAEMPPFGDLKNFGYKFSQIQQWTGAEYKHMLKVWIGVLAPFFKRWPEHLRCLKYLTEFILFAGYHSHTENTLAMMDEAMAGYESQLSYFVDSRDSGNFDHIPKLHMMRHYVDSI